MVNRVKQCLVQDAFTKLEAVTFDTNEELMFVRRPLCCHDFDLDIRTLKKIKGPIRLSLTTDLQELHETTQKEKEKKN